MFVGARNRDRDQVGEVAARVEANGESVSFGRVGGGRGVGRMAEVGGGGDVGHGSGPLGYASPRQARRKRARSKRLLTVAK